MKIVKLKGGLGNQMFQYAFAKLLERETSEEVKIDFTYYNSLEKDSIRVPRITKFNISLSEADNEDLKKICKLYHKGNSLSLRYKMGIFLEDKVNKKYFLEPNRAYINPETLIKYSYFDGYWQSHKYLDKIRDIIVEEFVANYDLSSKTQNMIMKVNNENSVFVGVRKGDYLKEASHYGSYSNDYYLAAMRVISEKIENPVFYVFSNDIEWCKENMYWENYNVVYREIEDQTDDFEELLIMSSCKHAIIVNSTFNWWGAYLISNPDKIICCPSIWFFDNRPIDIYPDEWIKIPVR